MTLINHPYHMTLPSFWPLKTAILSWFLTLSLIMSFQNFLWQGTFSAIILIMVIAFSWWKDVLTEATYLGQHTSIVSAGIRWGIILFIISEIMFFFSFFWTYFHLSLNPSFIIGSNWPPVGIHLFNPFNLPLMNTLILLSSGVTITWSHMALNSSSYATYKMMLKMTIYLAVLFLTIQMLEYSECYYSISDSSFGSVFFLTTGFHGLHVMVGMLFLMKMYHRKFDFTSSHNLGFEAASWYWHFVDVVWLFLFLTVYWWPSF